MQLPPMADTDPMLTVGVLASIDASFSNAQLEHQATKLRGEILELRQAEAPFLHNYRVLQRWFNSSPLERGIANDLSEADREDFLNRQAVLREIYTQLGALLLSGAGDYEYGLRGLAKLNQDQTSVSVAFQQFLSFRYGLSLATLATLAMGGGTYLIGGTRFPFFTLGCAALIAFVTATEHFLFKSTVELEKDAISSVLARLERNIQEYRSKLGEMKTLYSRGRCALYRNLGLLHGGHFSEEQPEVVGNIAFSSPYKMLDEEGFSGHFAEKISLIDAGQAAGLSVSFMSAEGKGDGEYAYPFVLADEQYAFRMPCVSQRI